jgi:hypothetical protein
MNLSRSRLLAAHTSGPQESPKLFRSAARPKEPATLPLPRGASGPAPRGFFIGGLELVGGAMAYKESRCLNGNPKRCTVRS